MQIEVIYDREREKQSVKNGFMAWQECYQVSPAQFCTSISQITLTLSTK